MPVLQQTCAAITGHQIFRVARRCHRQQKRVIRIIGVDLDGQVLQYHRPLQIIDHDPYFGGLQDGLELGVAAGPTDLVELYPRGDHLEARQAR